MRGITHLGGTILGTTNRGNPFRYVVNDAGRDDRSRSIAPTNSSPTFRAPRLRRAGLDRRRRLARRSPQRLAEKGLPVVGVPKTIDNDIAGTDRTFGFDTAVHTATDAIDRLHTTAESHDRVMVVEVMGRDAGWIALHSGIAGSADVILIPEIPFDMDRVAAKVMEREARGRHFSIVVVAEGAVPMGGATILLESAGAGTVDRLGGIGGNGGASASRSARARKCGRWCSATCSAAVRRPRAIGCWRCASARRRSAPWPTATSAP